MQIIEVKKFDLAGSILDVGSKKSPSNITNFIKNNKNITYLDKFSDSLEDLKIDLENKYEGNENNKFDNAMLFNVLEHIFNYQTCLDNCFLFLKKNGSIIGSTPFLYQIHGSPNDFFRYTSEALVKSLEKSGFNKIDVKVIAGGIFMVFYSSISTKFNKIPFLNNILFFACQLIDYFLSFFSKNLKLVYPLGFFFSAKK